MKLSTECLDVPASKLRRLAETDHSVKLHGTSKEPRQPPGNVCLDGIIARPETLIRLPDRHRRCHRDIAALHEFLHCSPSGAATRTWLSETVDRFGAEGSLWAPLAHGLMRAMGILVLEPLHIDPECPVRDEAWAYYRVCGTPEHRDPSVWGPDKTHILGQIIQPRRTREHLSRAAWGICTLPDATRAPVYSQRDVFRPAIRPDGKLWTVGANDSLPAGLPPDTIRIPIVNLVPLDDLQKGPHLSREALRAAAPETPEAALRGWLLQYETGRTMVGYEVVSGEFPDGRAGLCLRWWQPRTRTGGQEFRVLDAFSDPGQALDDLQRSLWHRLRAEPGLRPRTADLSPPLWGVLEAGAVSADEAWEEAAGRVLADFGPPRGLGESVVMGLLSLITEDRGRRTGSLVRPCRHMSCRRLYWLRDRKAYTCPLHRGTHRSHSQAAGRKEHRTREAQTIGVSEQRGKMLREKAENRAKRGTT